MNTSRIENPGTSPEAIKYHYDVGSNFYRLWLGSTMAYSCAIWEENEGYEALDTAQMRKLDFYAEQAQVKGSERILDIGCGWGSLLKRIVEIHDVKHVVGLTLSKAHAEWISAMNHPQIEVRLESWTEHSPKQLYDGIISIGAFEHFAKPEHTEAERLASYRSFFSYCHEWLKPGGWISIQTITYENFSRDKFKNQFFTQEVFPESDPPRLAEIIKATDLLFEVVALRNDRQHYIKTLKAWLYQLKANRTEAVALVGEEVVIRYEKYIQLAIIAFHKAIINLSRITMRKHDNPYK